MGPPSVASSIVEVGSSSTVTGGSSAPLADELLGYEEVLERAIPRIARRITKEMDCSDHDDFIQDTWIRVLLNRENLRNVENIDAWLHVMATRMMIDHLRKRAVVPYGDRVPEQGIPRSLENEVVERLFVDELLASMDPPDANLLRLSASGYGAVSDVAAQLGVSPQVVWGRIRTAKRRLERTARLLKAARDLPDQTPERRLAETHDPSAAKEGDR